VQEDLLSHSRVDNPKTDKIQFAKGLYKVIRIPCPSYSKEALLKLIKNVVISPRISNSIKLSYKLVIVYFKKCFKSLHKSEDIL
jgi:hypothetical protein